MRKNKHEQNEELKKCTCGDECECGEHCDYEQEHHNCNCNSHCDCGEHCDCDEQHKCSEDCTCGEECECGEECDCDEECDCGCETYAFNKDQELALQYINLARQVQADFENYRKHAEENIKKARIDGLIDAVKTLLPAVDVFEVALKQVSDEQAKQGIIMVKNQIEKSITDLGVTKIESVGKPFNPHFHNAVMTQNNADIDDDIITDEFQAGYMYKDKVIRFSQVRVNKN